MANTIQTQYFDTPFGELILGSFENELCLADWRYRKMRNAIDKRIMSGLSAAYVKETSEVIEKTKIQLDQYFHGERSEFNIPLRFVGSKFQRTVWNALLEIPQGTTMSYLELSEKLGNVKAIRAVASANGANSISIIVPCHRIIGSNGNLVGYAGGLNTKKKLLSLENALTVSQLSMFA